MLAGALLLLGTLSACGDDDAVTAGGDASTSPVPSASTSASTGSSPTDASTGAASQAPGPGDSATKALADHEWAVVKLRQFDERGPGLIKPPGTLTFSGDQVNFDAGCNQIGGTVEVSEGTLTVGALRSTKMMCEPSVMKVEAAVTSLLDGSVSWERQGPRKLVLRNESMLGVFLAKS